MNFQLLQMTGQDPLLDLAIAASNTVKSAAIGVGGQQAIPTVFGNHGNGMTDPNPANANYSALAAQRAQANQLNYTNDGQITGTNLLPYASVLPTNFQTIATAMNPPMAQQAAPMEQVPMGDPQKSASYQQSFDAHMQGLAQNGYFTHVVPGNADEWNNIVNETKTASINEAYSLVAAMSNAGYLDAVMPNIAPLIRAGL